MDSGKEEDGSGDLGEAKSRSRSFAGANQIQTSASVRQDKGIPPMEPPRHVGEPIRGALPPRGHGFRRSLSDRTPIKPSIIKLHRRKSSKGSSGVPEGMTEEESADLRNSGRGILEFTPSRAGFDVTPANYDFRERFERSRALSG